MVLQLKNIFDILVHRAMNNNFKNNKRGGFYVQDGKFYASVTQVLSVIDKPALRYWFGKEVYYAMVKDPSLNEQEALSAPYKSSETAAIRGSAVHSIVEAYKHGSEVTETTPELQPFVDAFWSFAKQNHLQVLSQEKTVFSEKYKYAGTLDLFATLNGSKKRIVLDVKTNKDGNIYDEAFLQASAYANALREGGEVVDGIAVVCLTPKGKFTYKEGEEELGTFLACKALFEWKNKEVLKKLMGDIQPKLYENK